MVRTWLFVSGGIILLFLGTNCAAPSRLEMDYRTSSRLSKMNQIYDPEAEKNVEPVYGLNGRAARANTEKYLKDFEKPVAATPSTLTIGISSPDKK